MSSSAINKIVIVGCGNVAWQLAKRLSYFRKYKLFVYNHQDNSLLQDFKSEFKCKTQSSLEAIIPDADVYFICVSDKHISAVSSRIRCQAEHGALVLHTSGSTRITAIKTNCINKGVFYPLQTFSKNDVVNWREVPLITETNNRLAAKRMTALARLFSNKILRLDFAERLKLHLAAVLVNNFTNALYVAAADLLQDENNKKESFALLLPLIRQTAKKLEHLTPLQAQTGPAKRQDAEVQIRHVKLLRGKPRMVKLYKQLSQLIVKQQTGHYA